MSREAFTDITGKIAAAVSVPVNADAEVLPGAVYDGTHPLGGAGIVNEKVFSHSRERFASLFLAVLQIVIIDIPHLSVIGNLVEAPVHVKHVPRAKAVGRAGQA